MKSNRLLFLLTLFATLVGHAQEAEVSFSVSGGFYDTVFSLSMSCTDESYAIRYTLNGGTPQANSHLYREPLCLDEHMYGHSDFYTIRCCPDSLWFRPDSVRHCIVIRAAAFDDRGNCVSEVVTNSYFIKALGCDTHGLPVVSLCADSLDLFGFEQGIMVPGVCFDSANADWSGNYYQHGREWERLCNVEFYELDNQGVNQQAGLRTHGGNARRELQKGLKVYARKDYGKKDFEHVFFPECENGTFRRLVLKPFRLLSYAVRDDVATKMAQTLNVEWQASRPTVLFIDGEYWGIYLLKEKLDEHCLAGHFGFKPRIST